MLSGSQATLWCTIKTKAPAKIQWIMNSKTLGPVLTHTGTINMTHVIPSVTNVNQGLYSCSATNVGGTGTASTQLRAKGRECCCNIIAEAPLLRHCYFEIKIFGATQ